MSNKSEKRADRLQLMLTHEEIELVDTWRFQNRMPSRSAAVRALLRLAFKNDESSEQRNAMQGISSGDVGILSSSRRVDRTIGIAGHQRPILVVGTDILMAHAACSLLLDLGQPLAGPFDTADAIRESATKLRPVAIVVVAGAPSDAFDAIGRAVGEFDRPTLVAMEDADAAALPAALGRARVISIQSMPEALAATVQEMLPTRPPDPPPETADGKHG